MGSFGLYPRILVDGKLVEQRARPTVDCSREPSKTIQSDRDEADINKIIKRFEKAGMISTLNRNEPFYGDVSEFNGLQDALIKVQDANELFMGISAPIRERFGNDPVQFIEFLQDPENRKEAEELGIIATQETRQTPAPSTPGTGQAQ